MPFKPAQGHRLQVKISSLNVLWRNEQTVSVTIKCAFKHNGQAAIEYDLNNR